MNTMGYKNIRIIILYIANEILDDEDTDDESEESGNKEDAERSILSTADNDENAYDLGSPKKSGSL